MFAVASTTTEYQGGWPLRVSSNSFLANLTDLSSRCKIIKTCLLLRHSPQMMESTNRSSFNPVSSGFLQSTCNAACRLLILNKDKTQRSANANSLGNNYSSTRRIEIKGLLEDVADTFGEAVSLSKGDVGM